jgi:hypothetical protein
MDRENGQSIHLVQVILIKNTLEVFNMVLSRLA